MAHLNAESEGETAGFVNTAVHGRDKALCSTYGNRKVCFKDKELFSDPHKHLQHLGPAQIRSFQQEVLHTQAQHNSREG